MKEIIIKSQAELDALPDSFSEYTVIKIDSGAESWIYIKKDRDSSHVVAWDSSHVVAWGSSHVEARGSSHVEARDSSHVVARDSSHVEARGSSHVVARDSSHVEAWGSSHVVAWGSSHVVAWGSSHVVARDSSHVVARDSSHVEAWDSSHVVAWGSSHVVARDSSHVVAWDSSHVVAWGSSHVEAWDSSHVVARDSSHVVAWDSSAVHNQSPFTTLEIGGFVVAWLLAKAKSVKKVGKNCRTVTPKRKPGTAGWLEDEGVQASKGKVVLFKRVSSDFKTQEGMPNETQWIVGSTVEHHAWNPTSEECGEGKYHACSRPFFCDEFRSKSGDRYVAIEIAVKDLYAWPAASYPHKVAFRKGKVLHECDKFSNQIDLAAAAVKG